MNEPEYQPFFYIIRNTETGGLYAGSRTSRSVNANPAQLLTSYFTSSKTVQALIQSGVVFEVVRIKTFDDRETTLAFESRFLRLYKCVYDPSWYNRHDGKNISPFRSQKYQDMLRLKYGDGVTCSMHVPGVAERISENLKGGINCWDEELRERRRVTLEDYHGNPDRYWHVQSRQYREKYKNGEALVKNASRTYYNVYDDSKQLIYQRITNFREFCKENGLPWAALQTSAQRNGERIYWYRKETKLMDPNNAKYRGWYAVWVDKDDDTVDHQPVEPVRGAKSKKIIKKAMPNHPTTIVIQSPTSEVLAIYRASSGRVANLLNIGPANFLKRVRTRAPLFDSETGRTHALHNNKAWLIGCIVSELPYDDDLVQNNLDKLKPLE